MIFVRDMISIAFITRITGFQSDLPRVIYTYIASLSGFDNETRVIPLVIMYRYHIHLQQHVRLCKAGSKNILRILDMHTLRCIHTSCISSSQVPLEVRPLRSGKDGLPADEI
jgi:hypothetical protein